MRETERGKKWCMSTNAYPKKDRGIGEDEEALCDVGHIHATEAASLCGGMVVLAHLWRDLQRI